MRPSRLNTIVDGIFAIAMTLYLAISSSPLEPAEGGALGAEEAEEEG